MQYMLIIFGDEARWAQMSADEGKRITGAYTAYTTALKEAGVWVGGSQLGRASTGTVVRVGDDGKTTVLDGPYVDAKEQLAGYYLIEAADLDAAISWAARCPGASYGTMEVRPLIGVPTPA